DHTHDLPVRLERPGEDAVQPGELLVPSHQPREPPRAGGVEARPKGADPPSSKTRTGVLTPFMGGVPWSRKVKNPSTSRAVCSLTYTVPGAATCSIRAARPTACPWAV